MRPSIQFEREALRVITDEEYRQPSRSVEVMAGIACVAFGAFLVLLAFGPYLVRYVR